MYRTINYLFQQLKPFYDDGKLGGTQSSLYIIVKNKDEGINLIHFINTKFFKFLVKSTKFNNFAISHEFISTIPDLSSVISNINDEKIFNYINLEENEIRFILDN